MINWVYYPKSDQPREIVSQVIEVFTAVSQEINSETHEGLKSDMVLSILRPGLESKGFRVEKGKKKADKIHVPVLFGLNGRVEKYFEADAVLNEDNWVLEIEAGRAYTNYQFLKDLFQASMMHNINYLGIAVRNNYRGRNDFEKVINFFDTMYASGRLKLPLKGILIVGY